MTSKLTALMVLFIIPAVMADENPHCVAATDSYNVTTIQCDNGSVTITSGGKKTAVVCNSGTNGVIPQCTEVSL